MDYTQLFANEESVATLITTDFCRVEPRRAELCDGETEIYDLFKVKDDVNPEYLFHEDVT